MNLALLYKKVWHLLTHADSILFQVYKSKYKFEENDVLNQQIKPNIFGGWRDIIIGCGIIKSHVRTLIGDEKETNIWDTSWVGDVALSQIAPTYTTYENHSWKVEKLIQNESWPLIKQVFPPHIVNKIGALHLPCSH